MSKSQSEFFAPTFGITKIGKMGNQDLFSSPALKQRYIEAMKKNQISKPVGNVIEHLVNKGVINPCYHSKEVASFIKFKINATPMEKSLCALLDISTDKIWIFMDSNTNFIGFAPSRWLAIITLHECIHLFASKKKLTFLSLFKEELDNFYINYFHLVFQLKRESQIDIHKIVKFIFVNYEIKTTSLNLKKYYLFLMDEFKDKTAFQPKEFERILMDYMILLKLYWTSPDVIIRVRKRYDHIIYPLEQAYELTFNKKTLSNMAFQELFLPSEVIAVSTEINTGPKIYKALSKL